MATQKKYSPELPSGETSRGKLVEERGNLKREQKSQTTRTVLKLGPDVDRCLRALGSGPQVSIRDILDLAAREAGRADKEGVFQESIPEPDSVGERKSYALSKFSLQLLNSLHVKHGISRESAIRTGLERLLKSLVRESITQEAKIEATEILIQAAESMLDIYYSEAVSKARQVLIDSEDPAYEHINETLAYVEQLNELPSLLGDYQRRLKNEAKSAC